MFSKHNKKRDQQHDTNQMRNQRGKKTIKDQTKKSIGTATLKNGRKIVYW